MGRGGQHGVMCPGPSPEGRWEKREKPSPGGRWPSGHTGADEGMGVSPAGGTGEGRFRLRAAYFARGGKVGKAPPGECGGKNTPCFYAASPRTPGGRWL